jgi:hypothetical protein
VPSFLQQPGDILWVVALVSTATTYTGWNAALTAAVTLSAANSNAVVQICEIQETVTGPAFPALAQVNLPGAARPLYLVQLQSSTTYYPLETARVQAYSTSASNSNGPVYVAKVIETITAP